MSAPPPRRPKPPATPPSTSRRPPARVAPAQPATRRPASSRGPAPFVRPPHSAARMIAIGGGLLILVVGAIFVFWLDQSKGSATPSGAPATMGSGTATTPGASTGSAIPGEIAQTFTDRGHTTDPITYKEVPPMGGPHWSDWINCGIYDKPVQNEQAVHSLEHGAVWITYQPDLPTDQVEILRNLVRQSGYRLLSPYPNLPHPIVASAWGYQLALDRADDPRLSQFVLLHQQDPNGPEPGASCSGSVGTPLP